MALFFDGFSPMPVRNDLLLSITAPSALTATADGGYTNLNVTWTDNSDNEDNFELQYDTDSGFGSATTVEPAANQEFHQITGLTRGNTYYCRIRAVNTAGNSDWSNSDNDTIFDISDVTLVLRLDADTGTYQDTGKVTAADGDTDPVALWEDQSGNGNDFQTGISGLTLQTNEMNSLPVVRGDGTGVIQNTTKATWRFMHDGTGFVGFFVMRTLSANPNTKYALMGSDASSGANKGVGIYYDDRASQTRNEGFGGNVGNAVPGNTLSWYTDKAAYPNQGTQIHTLRSQPSGTSGDDLQIRNNGTQISSAEAAAAYPSGDATYDMQIFGEGNNANLAVLDIGAVYVASGELTDAEIQEVEDYLAEKYGDENMTFNEVSSQTLWDASGSHDWLGRPALLDDTTNQKWVLVYRSGAGHGPNEDSSEFHIRFSEDEGATWTDEDTWIDGSTAVTGAPWTAHDSSKSVEDAAIIEAPNGDFLLFISEAWSLTNNRYGFYQFRSEDAGLTWSEDGQFESDNELASNGQAIVIGTDIYYAIWVDGGANWAAPYKSTLYKSTDSGDTWSNVADITNTTESTNEVGLAHLGGNNLLAILRDDTVTQTHKRVSSDLGATWGSLTDITSLLVSAKHRPFMRVFSDESDRIYLMGRWYPSGDFRASIHFTDDDGATWSMRYICGSNTGLDDGGYADMLKRSRTGNEYYLITYEGDSGSQQAAEIVEYILEKA